MSFTKESLAEQAAKTDLERKKLSSQLVRWKTEHKKLCVMQVGQGIITITKRFFQGLVDNGLDDYHFQDDDELIARALLDVLITRPERKANFTAVQLVRGMLASRSQETRTHLRQLLQEELGSVDNTRAEIHPVANAVGRDNTSHRQTTPNEMISRALRLTDDTQDVTFVPDTEPEQAELPLQDARAETAVSTSQSTDRDDAGTEHSVQDVDAMRDSASTPERIITIATPPRSAVTVDDNVSSPQLSTPRRLSTRRANMPASGTALEDQNMSPARSFQSQGPSHRDVRSGKKRKYDSSSTTLEHEKIYSERVYTGRGLKVVGTDRLSAIIGLARTAMSSWRQIALMAQFLTSVFDPPCDLGAILISAARAQPLVHDADLEEKLAHCLLGHLARMIGDPNASFTKEPKSVYQQYLDFVALYEAYSRSQIDDSACADFIAMCPVEHHFEDSFHTVVTYVVMHGKKLPHDHHSSWTNKIDKNKKIGWTLHDLKKSLGDGAILLLSGHSSRKSAIPQASGDLQVALKKLQGQPQLRSMFEPFYQQHLQPNFKQPWIYISGQDVLAICLAKYKSAASSTVAHTTENATARATGNGAHSVNDSSAAGPSTRSTIVVANMYGNRIEVPSERRASAGDNITLNTDRS